MKSQLQDDTKLYTGLKWEDRERVFDTKVTMAVWLTRFHVNISYPEQSFIW